MTEETLFPLEQILTVSARDYIDYFRESFSSNSADPCHYDFVGVHNQFYLSRSDSLKATSILKNFQKKVPSNTEVVVDYSVVMTPLEDTGIFYSIQGTALIPKKK